MRIVLALFLVASAVSGTPAAADPIMGRASVVDADTIEIHGARIRLSGIDAPEGSQTCTAPAAGKPIPCGRQAAFFVADMIEGKAVSCTPDGMDRYKRVLAHCSVGGEDIGSALVRAGWALAFVRYSREYVADEAHAREAKAGLWSMQFVPPWEWRAARARTP